MDDLIFLLVAVVMIGAGLYLMTAKFRKPKKELLSVEATIVDHRSMTSTSSNDGHGTTTTTSVYPVYEYQVDGKTYQSRGSVSITVFSKSRMQIGCKEMVRIDPNRPDRVHTDSEKNMNVLMGAFLLIFGLLILVILF